MFIEIVHLDCQMMDMFNCLPVLSCQPGSPNYFKSLKSSPWAFYCTKMCEKSYQPFHTIKWWICSIVYQCFLVHLGHNFVFNLENMCREIVHLNCRMMDMFNWLPALPEASSHHSRRQSCQPRWGWARLAPVQHLITYSGEKTKKYNRCDFAS